MPSPPPRSIWLMVWPSACKVRTKSDSSAKASSNGSSSVIWLPIQLNKLMEELRKKGFGQGPQGQGEMDQLGPAGEAMATPKANSEKATRTVFRAGITGRLNRSGTRRDGDYVLGNARLGRRVPGSERAQLSVIELCVMSCWALTPTRDVSAGALAADASAVGFS